MMIKNYLKVGALAIFLIGCFAQTQASPSSNPLNKAVAFVQDSVITATIKTKIAGNNNLPNDIKVTTNNGVVVLVGTVNSSHEHKQLVEIAQSTDGVKSVDTSNLLIKDSISPLNDFMMTLKIKALFWQEKIVGHKDIPSMSIHVSSKNGIVYLDGTVDNATQEKNAIDIAKSVAGVTRVESTIKIIK